MGRLIRLELRRTDVRPYLWGAAWIFLAVAALNGLMASLPAMTAAMGEPMTGDDLIMFSRWENLLLLGGVLNMACFGVLGGVVGARLVVSEYRGKGAILLLSYPVPRKKVLLAKCTLVFGLTFALALAANLIVGAGLALYAGLAQLVAQSFDWGLLLSLSAAFAGMAGAVGLMALVPGMARSSVPAAIVGAVVVDCAACQCVSLAQGAGLWMWTAGMLLLGLLSVLWTAGRVERLEAV